VFAAAGLGRGGVLAIMVPNQVELVTSMFAAWRLGAAVTPVNPALTAQEARYQIDDAGADRPAGQQRGQQPGHRRPAVPEPFHRRLPPAEGIPEDRRDLPEPSSHAP
jgi:acyl-CoA synthetase (AMP-forming)/AMP-acid ligase II